MSHGTAYTYPATGYAPQQYSYPSQQSSYPAQQYPHTAQQYQYAYYDQQYATGGSYPPSASHPSQPMGQSNGYASGAHASAKAPIPNAQPKLRAADVMRSVKVEGNKVHHYVYTNEKIRVPLPAGVDPNWLLEVYSIPEPSGRQAVVHGLTLPRRVKDFEKALKNINRSVLHAYTPLSALGVHADNIYVHRGIVSFSLALLRTVADVASCAVTLPKVRL
ncbi:hypothetical protein FKP32DRAFT_3945 [Trametes sanguinea]|nr:hypothetical protein FKP32DRAFT_3945 [Trametes sanguinea]